MVLCEIHFRYVLVALAQIRAGNLDPFLPLAHFSLVE